MTIQPDHVTEDRLTVVPSFLKSCPNTGIKLGTSVNEDVLHGAIGQKQSLSYF